MNRCENCNKRISQKAMNTPYAVQGRKIVGVYECPHCSAVLGQCYLGESYSIVKPYWATFSTDAKPRYFDLTVLGSNGRSRRHGWFDTTSRGIIQVG